MSTITYAKLVTPTNLDILRRVPNIVNPSEATITAYAKENGYKKVNYTDSPGEWYVPYYELSSRGAYIQQKWEPWDIDSKVNAITIRIQSLLDSTAAERNYDSIFTALTYLESKNPKFKKEAEALRDWRDSVWTECYAYLDKVEKGEAKIPDSWEEVEDKLPKFVWPEA